MSGQLQKTESENDDGAACCGLCGIALGYLLLFCAGADFLLGRLGIVDLTGVPWSPVAFGVIGSLIIAGGKRAVRGSTSMAVVQPAVVVQQAAVVQPAPVVQTATVVHPQ